jgi:hypothetical protein
MMLLSSLPPLPPPSLLLSWAFLCLAGVERTDEEEGEAGEALAVDCSMRLMSVLSPGL